MDNGWVDSSACSLWAHVKLMEGISNTSWHSKCTLKPLKINCVVYVVYYAMRNDDQSPWSNLTSTESSLNKRFGLWMQCTQHMIGEEMKQIRSQCLSHLLRQLANPSLTYLCIFYNTIWPHKINCSVLHKSKWFCNMPMEWAICRAEIVPFHTLIQRMNSP